MGRSCCCTDQLTHLVRTYECGAEPARSDHSQRIPRQQPTQQLTEQQLHSAIATVAAAATPAAGGSAWRSPLLSLHSAAFGVAASGVAKVALTDSTTHTLAATMYHAMQGWQAGAAWEGTHANEEVHASLPYQVSC